MKAADLTELLTLEQDVVAEDALGGQGKTPEDVDAVWAKVLPLSSREALQAQATQSVVTTRIRMRYRDDLVPTMRLRREDGTVFEIVGVRELVARQWLELDCASRVTA
jgi:SPP1 family predicted phage head-tail adaptor